MIQTLYASICFETKFKQFEAYHIICFDDLL